MFLRGRLRMLAAVSLLEMTIGKEGFNTGDEL